MPKEPEILYYGLILKIKKLKNMRTFYLNSLVLLICINAYSQKMERIKLNQPDTSRGIPVMKALSHRASASSFDTLELSNKDLSDLLWAGNGINRPETGKRTAASSYNSQDIDIYVFMQKGVFLYNPKENSLDPVVSGDHRQLIASSQAFVNDSKQIFLLVSDISRFKEGEKADKMNWAAIDAGIVAQNIMIFCASEGLLARPRVYMDIEKIRQILNLKENQHPILNIPVSYQK